MSARSRNAITPRCCRSFEIARTPRSAILLWLRSRCVTDRLSTSPLQIIRTLSSSRKLLERLRCVRVSAVSRDRASDRQSESFIPNRDRS